MTRDEAKKLIMIISAAYPNYKPADMTYTINLWWKMLEQYDYQRMAEAVQAYIVNDSSGFAPSIGALVEKYRLLNEPEDINEMEAWSMVSRAIRNGYYGAEVEYSKLPYVVQKAVGSPSQLRQWSQADINSIETVIQSNFIRTYRAESMRAQNIEKLPQQIKDRISQLNPEPEKIEVKEQEKEEPQTGSFDFEKGIEELKKKWEKTN